MILNPAHRILFSLALFSLILYPSTSGVAGTLPSQNFLPPVANINGKIEVNSPETPKTDLDTVNLVQVSPKTIKTSQPVLKLDNDLGINTSGEEFQVLIAMQRTLDDEDLKTLWTATVEKNAVIRFSLEKLATPPDLHNKKSSLFLKTINLMISGGTMAGTMLAPPGAGDFERMGTIALGDAARNLVNGNTKPQVNALSATEQIQLASLIDELQEKLVHSYHDYKNTLQSLMPAHQITLKNNALYSKALSSGNEVSILAAGTAYYKSLLNETELRQKAKVYRMALERLAGQDTVSKLQLSLSITPDLTQETAMKAEKPKAEPVTSPPSKEEIPAVPLPEAPQSAEKGTP